jgi:hypothetical protein
MRKLVLFLLLLSVLAVALQLTQKSQAAVSTTIAPAGTQLNAQDQFKWNYPVQSKNCQRSSDVPYAHYIFDVTTSGSYTFTMTTSGFPGVIYIYSNSFNPLVPCQNLVNSAVLSPNQTSFYTAGSPLTISLNAPSGLSRYVVVFSPKNANTSGTFSASVTGPAAVTVLPSITTTIANAGTPLNSQNNYLWQYPIAASCSNTSGLVPFAAYTFQVPATGLYTFTMNASGFAGVVHLYQSGFFNPNAPCVGVVNIQDDSGDLITGNTIRVPISSAPGLNQYTVVFSPQNPGEGGTFSASVTGPSAVTLVPPGDLAIASQPHSKSVTSGCQQTLTVYATGPLSQTFQWYEGVAGDLSTSIMILQATSNTYITPPLTSDKSYWVRVTSGSDHVDSQTIAFKVYQNNKTQFSGSLDPNQTWRLMTTFCQPTSTFVHYSATQVSVPADGNYTIHINRESDFTSGYAIHVYGSFDATTPCGNFWDVSVNSDLSTHLATGTYTVVVSATSPSQITGSYAGTISTIDDCGLPETIEQALLISGNPLDKAISPGTSTILTFAYIGGSNKLKTIQWYRGFSGDTSQPIPAATGTNYLTPVLNQSPPNQPTYYYYWARVTDSGQGTHADTRTAVVNVLNPPVTYADVLTQCDDVYPQVNGPTTFYKIFPFTVSTDGTYSFNVSANGFTPAVKLYQGFFSPSFPNINYYGPGTTQTIHAGPNIYYLVITTTAANQTGSFTLTVNGPDLVVPTPRPIITSQPGDQILLRNQTTTLNVNSSTPDVSYQWYTGMCTNKTPVNGANTNSFTTPPMTDYQDYWVKVSYGVMYVNSNVAHVKIKPEAINDTYTIDEDAQVDTGKPGVQANDKKADSKTITPTATSDTSFGVRTLFSNGALTYVPNGNKNGIDSFTYTVTDGILTSDPGTVTIIVSEINDPPVRTGGSVNDHTFTEDSAGGTLHLAGVSYGPGGGPDEATQTLTYKVTAVPPASVGQVTLANDTTVVTVNTAYTLSDIRGMKFKPAANGYGGPYPFTFAVTDNGNSRGVADPQTLSQSLNITLNGVADTPPTTSATTNEDTQTSGLVLNRNADDGAEVTHFQIIQITNGTLYKNDGVTQIDKGQFITYGEGHAGLKFKPNANLSSPGTVFSFDFQASLSNSGQGLGGSPVTATITVNPVADLPTVTGASTFANLQTTSGLVITRNQVDGSEIGFYKISAIANGTLYKVDGTTQINAGQFITAAEGLAGLRFTPAQDSSNSGTFQVQGAADSAGAGLGAAATANISVSRYDTLTTITSDSPAPSYLGQQVTVSYSVQNTSGASLPDGDIVVTVSGGPETCTATVAAGSCQLTLNAGGNPRTITATYAGNNQFNSSIGTKDHVVNGCTQNTTVTSTGDDGTEGTLRYIVDHACDGSTITFDPAVFDPANGPHNILLGTFGNISGNLLINKSLTIQGPGANILTVRRDPASRTLHFRIFNIAAGATASISGLTISNGFANGGAGLTDADGGGILNAGTLTLAGCVISGNQAGRTGLSNGSGGGIYNSGALTLINSTVSENKAFIRNGGGIMVESAGTANILNSTISGNTAANSGGAIAVSGTLNVSSSTIANNTGALSAGGIYHEMGTTSVTNSIVAGNTSATDPDVVLLSGLINSGGHNLIGKNDGAESAFVFGSPNTSADLVGNSSSPLLSLLGPLADNGGPTYTHLPLPGSPAIDAGGNGTLPQDTLDTDGNGNSGEPLPLDQRGQSRIAHTTVDIGAVEVSYAITSTSGAGQSAVINTSFATPLRATVTESGRAINGAQVTFAGPGAGPGASFNGNATVTIATDNSGVAESPAFVANETAGSYDVSAGLAGGTLSTTFGLTNTQGLAQVSLSNLTQTFDGTPRSVSATTIPSGLTVVLAYDGSNTPPTNAGSYQVTAMISDPNYSGQTFGTLYVARANQTINFGSLSNKTVGDAPFALSATATSGLPVSFNIVSGPASITGNILTINGPGTVVVRASQTGDANNNPAASTDRSFDISKIQATIGLANLNQTYDGKAKNAVVTTDPPNLNILTVSYSQNGVVVAAPTNAGSYDVTASLSNDSYQASDAGGTLVITKAIQSISFDDLPNRTLGDSDFAVGASASSGLAVSLAASGNCTIATNTIHLTGAGTCTVTASQDGDINYLAAGSVSKSFSIAKTTATITLGNLIHTYDGTAKAVTVSTTPSGLNVTLSYDGSANLPASAGSYAVIGTINDPNYQGSVTDQLVINKATPALTWSTPTDLVYGIALGATQLNATASVAGSFAYSPGAGTVLNAGSGQTLTVNFTPADAANYNTASKTVSLNVSKANQTITFAPLPNRTYGDAPFTLSATSSSGLEVSFSVIDGPATISGNSVSMSGAGPITIRALQSGDQNNDAAAAVDRTFTVSKANQTITFAPLPNRTYGDAPFTLSATSSSGLDVSFSVVDGPATISGNTLSLSGAGSITIRASQSGDDKNNAAAVVDRSFTVSKANQTITFAPLPNRTYGDGPFTLSATSSSGLDVSFSVVDGPATISGNTVSLSGAGPVTIRASQSGDDKNNAATVVDRSFTVSKANQTITFAPLPNRTYGDGPFTLSATSSSGLDVSFSVVDGPATISGNTVSLSGAGPVTIRASQSGDDKNNPAAVVDRSFTVSKANQTITFASLPNRTYGDGPFTLSATSSSGLDVSFSVVDGPATISGNTVSLSGAGRLTIRASQSGDEKNNAATAVDRSFTVSKANQTISFGTLNDKTFGDTDFALSATASSNLTVSFAANGNCTVNGVNVHLLGAGQCTLTASQTGNDDYIAAPSMDQTFAIAKAATTTAVVSSTNPAGFGQTVTLTATVASSAGSATGTVQFKDNETNLGAPATVNLDGMASFDISSLSAGVHTIRAEYSGDANFIASNGLLPGGQAVADNLPVIGFSASNYQVNESDGFIRIVVNRTGDAAPAITVDYATSDAGGPVDCSALNSGLASARCDFNMMFGRLAFAPNETQKAFDIPINMDSYTEGPEVFTITLSNLTSGSLAPATVTVTINDSPSSVPNASDDTTMFVRQQYHDFLNREPDAAGLAFWKNNIDKCNDPAQREPGQDLVQCIEVQRVVTSAAFFLSIEFRQTGGLVRDFYVAALDRPATNNLPALVEFARDTQRIQQGVIVGEGDWQQTLNENRASFMNDFVMRAEFVGLYPTTDSPAQYVDKLYQHAGVTPKTAQERNQIVAEFGAAGSAVNARARAQALLRVTQNAAFQARELPRGFVQMEYFGYLRRNPNDAPDRDFAGYEFWLTKLNQFDGDFLKAEMVKAFVTSDEYRRRFGN